MTLPSIPTPLEQIEQPERPAAAVNGTAVVVTAVLGAVVLVLGVLALLAFRPDASASAITFVGSSLATIGGLVALALGNRAVARRVDRVVAQTNGINDREYKARVQAESDAAELRVQLATALAERDALANQTDVRVALAATTGSTAVQHDPQQPG